MTSHVGSVAGVLLAETRRRPGRLLLTGLAVLVATVFAAGTLLLSQTLDDYVSSRSQETPAAAAAVVHPAAGAPLASRITDVPGVAAAVAYGTATLPVTGAGPGTEWGVRSDPMLGPLSRLAAPIAGHLPTAPDEVVVGKATAQRTGIVPGTHLTVAGRSGDVPVTVTGVVPLNWEGTDYVVTTPEMLTALGGTVEAVDVLAAPGVGEHELAARLAAALGPAATVQTGSDQRRAELAEASAAATAVLLGVGTFAVVALVAAAIVVASTFRIVLTQRRTQLALLRCVGAGRRGIVTAVLVEAALSGTIAGVLGIAIALLLGEGGLAAAAALGATGLPELGVPWLGMIACLLVAVLATVLAAVAPAVAASRIPPVAALGAAAAGETGAPPTGRRLAVAGLLAAVAAGSAVASALVAADEGQALLLLVVAASGLVAFAALVAAGPVLVRGLAATLGRVVSLLGRTPGRLATANALQVPRRTAATMAVLALGAGLTSALLVAVDSGQADAADRVTRAVPAAVAVRVTDASRVAAVSDRLAAEPQLRVWIDPAGPTTLLVDPAEGIAEAAVRPAVDRVLTGVPGVSVQYASDVRAELSTSITIMRAIGFGLVGMTLLVAVVGVGITLALSVAERGRETGLLRAVGLSRTGVRAMVAWEAVLGGTGAAVIGAAVGVLYGVLGLHVLGIGKGFTVGVLPQLAGLVVGVVVVAAAAAVAPAIRAGRVPPVRALQP
ncbi:FtsX-like permease family protein [Pseudonocardia sp. CA-107938]|uniref:ABC transporter permease n=1 Tax=Pseudonocardia sp. CA-107938 TaxID=3240021 RepID=UPI003D8EAD47